MKGWKFQMVIVAFLLVGFIILLAVVKDSVQSTKLREIIVEMPMTTEKMKEAVVVAAAAATVAPPEIYQIPADEDLNGMSDNTLMAIYWKYINMLQVLCRDIVRIGSLKDGGKEICLDKPYKPRAPCLVYSFGINNQFDFDKDIVGRFECDVHCFDPSMNKSSGRLTDHIWFYNWGLSGENRINENGWNLKTLDVIRKELGHTERVIDILKIDIEGDEWNAIPQMVTSGALDDVKQISMETHFATARPNSGPTWGNRPPNEQLSALRQLFDFGYRIFMRERNMWSHFIWPGVRGYSTFVNEISVIKPPKR